MTLINVFRGGVVIAWSADSGALDLATLGALYAKHPAEVERVVGAIYARIAADGDPALWIALVPREAALARAAALAALGGEARAKLPLYGIPFAVKDNIDVAAMPTTAACPDYAFTPAASANVVRRLVEAGAILIGKTNLDQFATGLVGVRSPYGTPRNAFDPAFVPGGSSSGSATAVAKGLASFALGTDTAGSGRVPAAFNNIVGLKPTRGAIGASGVVPACCSLDCVSIFALTVSDAAAVLSVAAGDDPADPFGRAPPPGWSPLPAAVERGFRVGVPRAGQRRFFGNRETPALFENAVAALRKRGGTVVEIDYAPFAATAELLYQGPWVAERFAAIKDFIANRAEALHPVTRGIIAGATKYTAVDAYEAIYRLQALRRATAPVWGTIDFMLLPTAGTIFTLDEVAREPVQRNTDLGYYTNFVNLLDLAGIAVPAGFQTNGLPFGVTLIGPAWDEARLAGWADMLHRAGVKTMGATKLTLPKARASAAARPAAIRLMVVGAHMRGLPLNGQLTALGARFHAEAKTAKQYRFYDLGGTPARPGMVRVGRGERGAAIAGEIYDVPLEAFGAFQAQIPPPLSIGTVELEGGDLVKGFLCEAYAVERAKDITALGGWRAYLAKTASPRPPSRQRA